MGEYENDLRTMRRALLSRLDAGQDVGEFVIAAIIDAQRELDRRADAALQRTRNCWCGHSLDRHADAHPGDAGHSASAGVCGVRPYGQPCWCTSYGVDAPDSGPEHLTANRPGSWEAAIIDQALESGGYYTRSLTAD